MDGWTDRQMERQLDIHKIPALLHLLVKGVSQFSHFIFLQPQLIFLLPQKTASKDRIAYSKGELDLLYIKFILLLLGL